MHASYKDRVEESAKLYFPAGSALVVLAIDPRKLDVPLHVADTPRGPMPHVHGSIPRDAVTVIALADAASHPDVLRGYRSARVVERASTLRMASADRLRAPCRRRSRRITKDSAAKRAPFERPGRNLLPFSRALAGEFSLPPVSSKAMATRTPWVARWRSSPAAREIPPTIRSRRRPGSLAQRVPPRSRATHGSLTLASRGHFRNSVARLRSRPCCPRAVVHE